MKYCGCGWRYIRLMQYILPHKRAIYNEKYDTKVANGRIFKQTDRENNLVYLMKSNFVETIRKQLFIPFL